MVVRCLSEPTVSEHVHDCPTEGCNGYTVCSVEDCEEPQTAPCRGCLLEEILVLTKLVEDLRKDADKAMAAMDYGRDDSRWVPGETALDALIRERDELRNENERLRGLAPELPPRAPEGDGLPRYGLRWSGPDQPLAVPMVDGYWTPWHLAEGVRKELEERWGAEVGHANRHHQTAQDLRGVLAEFERRERHHALYNAAWLKAVEEGSSSEEAHKIAQKECGKTSKP